MEWFEIVMYSLAGTAFVVFATLAVAGFGSPVPPPPIKTKKGEDK